MVEVQCPYCDGVIGLENDKSNTYECPYCHEDFDYESSIMEQSINNLNDDDFEGEILLHQVIENKDSSGAKLLAQTIFEQGGRYWGSSTLKIFFGTLVLIVIFSQNIMFEKAMIVFVVFLIAGTGLLGSGFQNLISPHNLEQISYSIWFHQRKNFVIVVKEITDIKNKFHHEPVLISSVHLSHNYTVRIGKEPPSEAHMSEGYLRVCIWDQSSSSRHRVVLNLKFFEWGGNEDAERAARSYAKTLGISFDGEYQEPSVLLMIPQNNSVSEFDR